MYHLPSAPVPSSASSAEALLGALREWARAEASSVRGADASDVATAKAYATKLDEYAKKVGKDRY